MGDLTVSKNVTNVLNETCKPSEKAAFSMREETPVYLTLSHFQVPLGQSSIRYSSAHKGIRPSEDKCTSETVLEPDYLLWQHPGDWEKNSLTTGHYHRTGAVKRLHKE